MDDNLTVGSLTSGPLNPEILRQLQVLGRIRFPLKPTTVSAKSESSSEGLSDGEKGPYDPNTHHGDPGKDIDGLIDHVGEMENLVEQMEDMTDDLLKDMNIPPSNKMVSDAAIALGSSDGNINKDVLDNALNIMDFQPLMLLGSDPVAGALTGDGEIDGPWMTCDQFTKSVQDIVLKGISDQATARTVNAIIPDQVNKVAAAHDKRMTEMVLEMILMLWWNIIWCRFIVDLSIINPMRTLLAYPIDGLILFFRRVCNKRSFRKKSKECILQKGPINKALTKVRKFLLCKVPKRAYSRYKPPEGINCATDDGYECPPSTTDDQGFDTSGEGLEKMEDTANLLGEDIPCGQVNDFLNGLLDMNPEGPGASPDCLKFAKIVLDAIVADALTPAIGEEAQSNVAKLAQEFIARSQ